MDDRLVTKKSLKGHPPICVMGVDVDLVLAAGR